MAGIKICDYEPERDEPEVYALWQQELGANWPLSLAAFRHKTIEREVYRSGDHHSVMDLRTHSTGWDLASCCGSNGYRGDPRFAGRLVW